MTAPYGQTLPLHTDIPDVECWNYDSLTGTLPAGTTILVERVNDATHTTVMVEAGAALVYGDGSPQPWSDTRWREPGPLGLRLNDGKTIGYRFIVDNQLLGAALGVEMPLRTRDIISEIIAFETGELDDTAQLDLLWALPAGLQGRYGRCKQQLENA